MGKKILIIDDDVDLSKQLAETMMEEGHIVDVHLYTPEELLYFKPQQYEIIILDFKMPNLTGADILKSMPENNSGPKIFILSGRPFVEKVLKDEGLMGKVTEIIKKPFSIQNLLSKINAE